ncbi:MAG: cyclic nucleotide-binding domain-containing protein [Spirochaetales bacterium]|nr:cyclic nucleotide-binding domain-containing protein [Spirochaetales bacterium]
MDKLTKILHPGLQLSQDQKALALIVAQSFFMGLAFVLFYANSSSLFLTTFGANFLPYIYLSVGVLVPVASWGFSRLQRHWSLDRTAPLILIIFLLMFLVSWTGLFFPNSEWLSFLLMIGYALGNLFSAIVRGALAGQLFDARALKRNYPVILGGHVFSIIIGGALIPVFIDIFKDPAHLLLVSGLSMGLGLVMNLLLVRIRKEDLGRNEAEILPQKRVSITHLFFNKYIILILVYQVFSAVGSQLVDFLFNSQAEHMFDTAEALARFFGNFMAVVTAVGLIVVLFVAGRLLVRFGMSVGLAANPVMVFLMLVAASIVALVTGTVSIHFFWLALGAMALDFICTTSFTDTSMQSSYQPVSRSDRARVQTLIEGIGIPAAFGLTGVLLIILQFIPWVTQVHIVIFTTVVFGIWVGVSILLFRSYSQRLSQSMRRRTLQSGDLLVADKLSYNLVGTFIQSNNPVEISMGLDLLESSEYELYYKQLVRLCDHPHPQVRIDVYHRIERGKVEIARNIMAAALDTENDPSVRAACIRAFCALDEEPQARLLGELKNKHRSIRLAVMTGLLKYGGIGGVLEVGHLLITLAQSRKRDDRVFAAELLGEVGAYSFYQPLMKLLTDRDPLVRRTAVKASRKVCNPKLWPRIIENLRLPYLRAEAQEALAAFGADIIPLVEEALHARTRYDKDIVICLVRVLSRVRGERVVRFLEKYVPFYDFDIGLEIKKALFASGYRITRKDRKRFDIILEKEVKYVVQIRLLRQLFTGQDHAVLLEKALSDLSISALHSVFLTLSFMFESRTMQGIYQKLSSPKKDERALAAELVDLTLHGMYHDLVLPLVEEGNSDEKLYHLYAKWFKFPVHSFASALKELIEDNDKWPEAWLNACALYTVMKSGLREFMPLIEEKSETGNLLVRETAFWVLSAMFPKNFLQKKIRMAANDPVALLFKRRPGKRGRKTMLFTIEKVLVLKAAKIFSSMPDYLLASIAGIVEEVEAGRGETFLKKGEVGDCMYIIADGKVRIHDNDKELATFGRGEAVGELAVLDPETRSASATALENTLLFRLNKDDFDDLLADRPEIAQGVIHVLCQRIRETSKRSLRKIS